MPFERWCNNLFIFLCWRRVREQQSHHTNPERMKPSATWTENMTPFSDYCDLLLSYQLTATLWSSHVAFHSKHTLASDKPMYLLFIRLQTVSSGATRWRYQTHTHTKRWSSPSPRIRDSILNYQIFQSQFHRFLDIFLHFALIKTWHYLRIY